MSVEKEKEAPQWEAHGQCGVYVPEGYEGTLDVIVYSPGSGGGNNGGHMGADVIPYNELVKQNPDKIIIYDYAGGLQNEEDVIDAINGIDGKNGITVGTVAINAHSAGADDAITGAIAISNAGYTVGNVNVFDPDLSFRTWYGPDGGLSRDEWNKFAQTGAAINVFSRGGDIYENTEHNRLAWVAQSGIPITYSLCDYDKNGYNWEEKHAAINRDIVANGVMDVIMGGSNTLSFDNVWLTHEDYRDIATGAYHVTGFKYTDVLDPATGQWTRVYSQDVDGDDYSAVVAAISRNAALYNGGSSTNALIGDMNNKLDTILTEISAFDAEGAISSLPSRDNLVVYKDELSAFLSSPALASLQLDIDDANALNNKLAGFVNNSVLVGEIWNLAYQKIGIYDARINQRIQVAAELDATLRSAVTSLMNSMSDYQRLDTSDLSELQQISDNLQLSIDSLKLQILQALEDGEEDLAIALQEQLDAEEIDKSEVDKEIRAIEALQTAYDGVKPSLESAISRIGEFNTTVASISPSEVYTYIA